MFEGPAALFSEKPGASANQMSLFTLLLMEINDPNSSLHLLKSHGKDLIRILFEHVKMAYFSASKDFRPPSLETSVPRILDLAFTIDQFKSNEQFNHLDCVGAIGPFPRWTGLCCRMMPFNLEDRASLPDEFQLYWPLISAARCLETFTDDGEAYLTIEEKILLPGQSQLGKHGIHVDGMQMPYGGCKKVLKGSSLYPPADDDDDVIKQIEGGAMICSNLNTLCGWDCGIPKDWSSNDGNVTHLLGVVLPSKCAIKIKASRMFWITDQTPIASVSVKRRRKSQFLKIVSKKNYVNKHNK